MGAALAALTTSTTSAVPPARAGKLVFATAGDESDRLEIPLINADGTGMRKLTHNAVGGLAPRWTRNGRKIVFWTAGGSELTRLTRTPGIEGAPDWR